MYPSEIEDDWQRSSSPVGPDPDRPRRTARGSDGPDRIDDLGDLWTAESQAPGGLGLDGGRGYNEVTESFRSMLRHRFGRRTGAALRHDLVRRAGVGWISDGGVLSVRPPAPT